MLRRSARDKFRNIPVRRSPKLDVPQLYIFVARQFHNPTIIPALMPAPRRDKGVVPPHHRLDKTTQRWIIVTRTVILQLPPRGAHNDDKTESCRHLSQSEMQYVA
jgi:hypothetical protein